MKNPLHRKKPKTKRAKRSECVPFPECLTMADVVAIDPWPLGSFMTKRAEGENWTDCIIQLDKRIRLGGKYNTRRVRYDGSFYIVHNGERVAIVGDLALEVLEVCSHVYGVCSAADFFHNKRLKGY